MGMAEIRTARLLLRPASPRDLDAIQAILSDPNATEFWSTLPHSDMAQTEAWLSSMLAIEPHEGEDFVIERDGQVIGKAGFYRFPEIGFILHPREWGKGYAREALQAILDRAFTVHRLPAVEADVDPRNAGCLRLLEGLGFERTGHASNTWNIGGKWYDSVYLGLRNPASDSD